MKIHAKLINKARQTPATRRLFALTLCLCLLLTGPCWPTVVRAAQINQIHAWGIIGNNGTSYGAFHDGPEGNSSWEQSQTGYITFPYDNPEELENEGKRADFANSVVNNFTARLYSYWIDEQYRGNNVVQDNYNYIYTVPIREVHYDETKSKAVSTNAKTVWMFKVVLDSNYSFGWQYANDWINSTDSSGNAIFYVMVQGPQTGTPDPPVDPEPKPGKTYDPIIAFRLTLPDGTIRTAACNDSKKDDPTGTVTEADYVDDHDITGVTLYWYDVNDGNIFENETEARAFADEIKEYLLEVLTPWNNNNRWNTVTVTGANYISFDKDGKYARYEIIANDTAKWSWTLDNRDTTVHFYVNIGEGGAPKENITGVTDWMPRATGDDAAWTEPGQEGKEITEARDSEALKILNPEEPEPDDLADWLNSENSEYKQLIVKTGEGWSEPYDVIWSYDKTRSDNLSSPAAGTYYVFTANTGDKFFYGADNAYAGKGKNSPLTFYLYILTDYIEPPVSHTGVTGWRVFDFDNASDPDGGKCGEITVDTVIENGSYYTEYIHIASEIAFQNEPGTDAFADEMKTYLEENFFDSITRELKYRLEVNYGNGWNKVDIKSIKFSAGKTATENTAANRNYDVNRRVAMFKLQVDGNYYWKEGAQVEFYISVTEAPVTRNPVTNEDDYEEIAAKHVVNKDNYPNNFGGPVIEQPKGVTVNLFDYWLEGNEEGTEPGYYDKNGEFVPGTGNLDTAPFYNWTSYNAKWETPRSENVFQSGINIGHLLLFGGGNRFRGWQKETADTGNDNTNVVGEWNFYTGDLAADSTVADGNMQGFGGPKSGIVQNKLDENGYPVLNLNDDKWLSWKDRYRNDRFGFDPRSAPWSFFGTTKEYDGATWYWAWGEFPSATLYKKNANDASNKGGETSGSAWFNPYNPPTDTKYFSPIKEEKLTESLAYLFDPNPTDSDGNEYKYRKVYEDVRSMFRLDEAGYYYFNAPEELFDSAVAEKDVANAAAGESDNMNKKGRTNVYAELDTAHKTDEKTGKKYYEMKLYDKAYGTQFFPFDEWGKSFEYDKDTGEVKQNRFEPDQYDAYETEGLIQIDSYANNLNHFFGMTMEAIFQQPLKGLVNDKDMVFQFSGDDDVWIFIDNVLVGDLGGVHSKSSIEIDFATGKIRIQDRRWAKWAEDNPEKNWSGWNETSLYEMFRTADSKKYPDIKDIKAKTAEIPEGWMFADDDRGGGLIFTTNTIHELKFFYMERGHEESNLSLSFNFPESWSDRVQKVSEDGESLSAESKFSLYKAYRKGPNGEDLSNELIGTGDFTHRADEFTYDKINDLITKDITDEINQGYADLGEKSKLGMLPLAYDKYDTKYFVLEETETPKGYRTGTPIVFQYDSASNTLVVVNRYETGAYTSYIAKWIGKVFTATNSMVKYMIYDVKPDERNKPFKESAAGATASELDSGLTVIIPIIKQTDNSNSGSVKWYPMYGSNTYGWHTVEPNGNTHEAFVKALTRAAVMQITVDATNTRDWYLTWNDYYQRLEGFMENLPGNATRFLNYNKDGDMSLVPLYLPESVLKQIVGDAVDFDEVTDDEARFALLKDVLQRYLVKALNSELEDKDIDTDEKLGAEIGKIKSEEDLKNALEALTKYVNGLTELKYANILDNSSESFDRQPRTVIYVPNEQRELRVRKVDQYGNYVDGAIFAIFKTAKEAAAFSTEFDSFEDAVAALEKGPSGLASYGQTGTVTLDSGQKQEGLLIFREDDGPGEGYAQIEWPSARSTETGDDNDNVYWLKEIYAPEDYILNEYLVRIEVGNTAIYANATGYEYDASSAKVLEAGTDDGITVRAALGKLAQTLVKYALDNNVDVTLRDISITKQTQPGGANGALNSYGWADAKGDNAGSFNLHYGINAAELTGQYGRHSEDAELPFFTATDGYIRVMPRQNLSWTIPGDRLYNDHATNTRYDTVVDENGAPLNLDSLFGLMNVVVVENKLRDTPEASLEITKMVVGMPGPDDVYQFKIELKLPEGSTEELEGPYEAYIRENGNKLYEDQAPEPERIYVYVDENGEVWVMADPDIDPPNAEGNLSYLTLEDGQTCEIYGLPEGTGFTITEIITTTSGSESQTKYDTTITVKDHLTKKPETDEPGYTVDKNNRTVTGTLNSTEPEDPEAAIKSVKVHYTNTNSNIIELPDTGSSSTLLYYGLFALLLAVAFVSIIFNEAKNAQKI